ncbi:MAG TPA: hypothetical protein VF214_01785 [Edaphobacter sp.]
MPHKQASIASLGTLALLVLLGGCTTSPLAKNTAAFSSATNLVVDSSENAYRAAVRLHNQEQIAAATARYDTTPNWDPHNLGLKPLIDEQGLEARSQVLEGLKLYAQTLSDLTNHINSEKLDAATVAVGNNLKSLSGNIANATGSGFKLSQAQANITCTALDALATFLVSRKVSSGVPGVIKSMDPHIETITQLLIDDIVILRRQAHNDYEQMLTQQDSFIRHAQGLSPVERRAEINRLPEIVQRQQATDDMLADLQSTLSKLALAHHALAAAAENKNPEAFRSRLADLEAASRHLYQYYSSLPPAS